ncbi:hypothetical protein [Priestia aryabhattai]
MFNRKANRRAPFVLSPFSKNKNGTLPENSVMLKTIVTPEFGRAIGDEFKIKTVNTLTGFKFIVEKNHEYN